jgi:radical SAM superfamily enzyme YgiQ (UPF0313 family)
MGRASLTKPAVADSGPQKNQAVAEVMGSEFLFVYPERAFGGFCSRFGYHLGVSYILAYGAYRPDQARTFFSDNRSSWDETAARICKLAKKGVGFSVYEHNYVFVSNLATRIRARRPDLLIVCGGPSATFSARRILADNPAIDLCVAGEAERTFQELYNTGFSRNAWPGIPGLFYRDGDTLFATGSREYYCSPEDKKDALSGLPSPYLEGFLPVAEAPNTHVSSSRGCPYACTYCSFTAIGGRFIRFVPAAVVLAELKMICDYFRKTAERVTIHFTDDNFTVRMARTKLILAELAAFRPENVTFNIQARPDGGLDEEFYRLAKSAGIAEMNFGLESADPHVLALVNKLGPRRNDDLELERNYIDQARKQVLAAARHGIDVSVSIILGLPGDTKSRGKKTLNFVRSLPIKLYGHNLLNIFDGTELARTYMDYGLDLVVGEHAPFPTTIHTYDVKALPLLSHCDRTRVYSSQILVQAVIALTGMAGGCLLMECPCVYLDFAADVQEAPAYWQGLPLGTHFLVKSLIARHKLWRALGFGSVLLEPFRGGFLLSQEVLEGSSLLPIILFPGQAAEKTGKRCSLEFIAMGPEDDFPQSKRNHWRLPYAACGLLPASCPGKNNKLRSKLNEGGCCPFHDIESMPAASPPCEKCVVRDRCPQCHFFLARFGTRYCDFQHTGKPYSILAYLLAHLNVLRTPEFRLNDFPDIRLEDFPTAEANARVVTVGDKLHVIRTL